MVIIEARKITGLARGLHHTIEQKFSAVDGPTGVRVKNGDLAHTKIVGERIY